MNLRPIEIIGGGLAGLSLGIALRRAGVPVTLHEAGRYPRHRVCGEFITGLAPATLAQLGLGDLLADALRHREVAWFPREGGPQIQRLPAPALGLSRHDLDARLAEKFIAAGGDLHTTSRATGLADRPGRVFANGRRRATASPWIGLKIHVHDLVLIRDLEMHLGAACYVGLTRVEEGAVNLCGLFRRRPVPGRGPDLIVAYLRAAGLGLLADRLNKARFDLDSFSAVAALAFDRRMPAGAQVSIGDAGAMIPPFTGNGMAMAFQSAALALGPLLAYARNEAAWPETRGLIQRALRGRFRLRLAAAGALHAFLLRPHRQRWFAALGRARLLPFGPLYASLH